MTGITIKRDPHSQQFVIIHNRVARDGRLSRSARGLLVELLSLPPGARCTLDSLIGSGPEGRAAIRRMLRQLEECGYIVRTKERDERGRIHWPLTVFETPQESAAEEVTTDENQHMEPPAETPPATPVSAGGDQRRFSTGGKPHPYIKNLNPKDRKNVPAPRSAGAGGDAGLQVRGRHPAVTRGGAA